jgi:hypothetical protein
MVSAVKNKLQKLNIFSHFLTTVMISFQPRKIYLLRNLILKDEIMIIQGKG